MIQLFMKVANKAIDYLCMLLFIPIFGIFVVLCDFPELDKNQEDSEYELERIDSDISDKED